MNLRINKKGFGLTDAIGAVIILGIAAVTVTSSLLQSVAISSRYKQRLLTQTACEFYVSAIKSDVEQNEIATFFDTASVQVEGNKKTCTINAGDSSAMNNVKNLLGSDGVTWTYYSTDSLLLNGTCYNANNVSIVATQELKTLSGETQLYMYTISVEIPYNNGKTEVKTYDFYFKK